MGDAVALEGIQSSSQALDVARRAGCSRRDWCGQGI